LPPLSPGKTLAMFRAARELVVSARGQSKFFWGELDMNSRLPKASISALLLSAALIIATAFPLQGQSTSYVPALQARDGADLGIALVNPTLSEAKVTLTARDYTGAIIRNNAITNPLTLALPASGQIAVRAAQVFGSGISGQAGWLEVSASTPAVKGVFSAF